jgi:magnesium transporter
MLRIYFKTAKEEEFSLLTEPKEGCWIHADEATTSDLNTICAYTGLEYADLQDCLDRYEMPRLEHIKHHLLIFTRYPTDQEVGLYTSTLTIILANHYFITISPDKSLLVDSFLQKKTKISSSQKSKLLLHLLLKITQEFNTQIRRVRYSVLTKEKEMIKVESEDITVLTTNEEVLNQYSSALSPLRVVLETILSGRAHVLYEKDRELAEDLLNAIKQSEELCSIAVKSIRSLRDAYQIIFTNNLHKTIKLLTALTIIFSIPTMIASLYGMNVGLPLANAPHAFTLILGITFLISLAGFLLFKRKRWL